MALNESETAQYNAMQYAFIEAQETIQKLRLEIRELKTKLNQIVDIIEGED